MPEAIVVAIIGGVFLLVGAAIGALSSLLTTWLTSRGAEKQDERQEILRRRERGEQAAFELLQAIDEAVADTFSYRRESQKRRRHAEEAKALGWPADTGYSFGPELLGISSRSITASELTPSISSTPTFVMLPKDWATSCTSTMK